MMEAFVLLVLHTFNIATVSNSVTYTQSVYRIPPCACLVLCLRCSSLLPNSMLSLTRVSSHVRWQNNRIVRTHIVYPRTAVTQQSFAPVNIASRRCSALLILKRTFLEETNMRAGSGTNRAATHTSAQYPAVRYPASRARTISNSHSQLWFLSATIVVHYAIGTIVTNADFERPVRGTPARSLLPLLFLLLLEASADADIAPRDSSSPASSGDLS